MSLVGYDVQPRRAARSTRSGLRYVPLHRAVRRQRRGEPARAADARRPRTWSTRRSAGAACRPRGAGQHRARRAGRPGRPVRGAGGGAARRRRPRRHRPDAPRARRGFWSWTTSCSPRTSASIRARPVANLAADAAPTTPCGSSTGEPLQRGPPGRRHAHEDEGSTYGADKPRARHAGGQARRGHRAGHEGPGRHRQGLLRQAHGAHHPRPCGRPARRRATSTSSPSWSRRGARCIVPPTTNPSMDLAYVEEHLWAMPADGRGQGQGQQRGLPRDRRHHDAELHAGDREERAGLRRDRRLLGVQRHAVRELGARRAHQPRVVDQRPVRGRHRPRAGVRLPARREPPRRGRSSRSRPRSRTTSTGACSATPTRRCTRAPEVPVFTGIDKRARPRRASCSSAPSSPRPARSPCTTSPASPRRRRPSRPPSAATPPKAHVTITDADLDRVREQFAGEPGPIEYAMLGCPHLTIRQVGEIAAQIEGSASPSTPGSWSARSRWSSPSAWATWAPSSGPAGTSSPTPAWTCPAAGTSTTTGPGVTESQKCAFYCQVYGQRYAVRPLAQAVASRPRGRGGPTEADLQFTCRPISEGVGEGEALALEGRPLLRPLRPETGCVLEKGHASTARASPARCSSCRPARAAPSSRPTASTG